MSGIHLDMMVWNEKRDDALEIEHLKIMSKQLKNHLQEMEMVAMNDAGKMS